MNYHRTKQTQVIIRLLFLVEHAKESNLEYRKTRPFHKFPTKTRIEGTRLTITI